MCSKWGACLTAEMLAKPGSGLGLFGERRDHARHLGTAQVRFRRRLLTAPTNFFYTGTLAYGAVYTTALSAAQISEHYLAGTP